MSGNPDRLKHDLRQRAEQIIQTQTEDFSTLSTSDVYALLHDLNVHQIELELQNEELKQAHNELQESQNRFHQLFEMAPVGYLCLDQNGLILQSNKTFQQLLGYTTPDINGKYFANFVYPNDLSIYSARFKAFFLHPENKTLELRLSIKATECIVVELKARLVDSQLFKFTSASAQNINDRLLVNVVDVSQRYRAEQELQLAAKVFETSEEGILIVDANSKILKVNASFTAITGYQAQEVIGKTPAILKSGRHDTHYFHSMWSRIHRHGSWQGEIWNKRKNGDLYVEWLSITSIKDRYGRISHYIGIFTDITVRKKNEEQIEKLAHYDPLTELPNRVLLNDRLKQAIIQANRHHRYLTIMFLDMDRFKLINDTMGHFVGDLLLQEVAKRLVSCIRESDTVARFGGDEFIIVLTDFADESLALANSQEIARKILKAFSKPFELDEGSFSSSTSIGIAVFPKHGQTVTELVKNADTAMYHAKSSGRNNYQMYTDAMHDENFKRSQMIHDIQLAARLEQFTVFYQPKINLLTNEMTGLEALVRWKHPQYGLVLPDEFISSAEESKAILELGAYVLKTACQQLKHWHQQGHHSLTISVNLSTRQLLQHDLPDIIKNILANTGLDPKFLELEITESVMMENITEAIGILKLLIAMGCTITLDDFGTGYASLTYLKRLPVQCLKIDRSFIRDLTTDPDDKIIVDSILSIANHMQMKVIAEGVETEQHVNYLKNKGCYIGQGHFFSPPLPAREVVIPAPNQEATLKSS